MSKHRLLSLPILLLSLLLPASWGTAQKPNDSEIKIAVLDMQAALDQYVKTKIETDKLNHLSERRKKEIDDLGEEIQGQKPELESLRKQASDSALSEKLRNEAGEKFKKLAAEVVMKEQRHAFLRRKATVEIATAQKEVETVLIEDIKSQLTDLIANTGYDLVFDKSFLPKAKKSIIYTSGNVTDLTEVVIAELNKNAAEAEAAAATAVETGESALP